MTIHHGQRTGETQTDRTRLCVRIIWSKRRRTSAKQLRFCLELSMHFQANYHIIFNVRHAFFLISYPHKHNAFLDRRSVEGTLLFVAFST